MCRSSSKARRGCNRFRSRFRICTSRMLDIIAIHWTDDKESALMVTESADAAFAIHSQNSWRTCMTDNQKIALITGASRGLGRNTAVHLAEKGVGVVITYLSNESEADTVIKEIEARGAKGVALQLDVSKSDTFKVFKQRFVQLLK